jgi:hypothetical protein
MNDIARQQLRDQRTYHVSDERLRAFAKLSYAERLAWVEQCSTFVRLGQLALGKRVQDPSTRNISVR